jgi:hypothetical protein
MSREPATKVGNEDERFPLLGYVIINLIFWAYCVVQLLVIKWLLRETTGLYFFFGVLAIGFTLVSIYDYAYDRISLSKQEPGSMDVPVTPNSKT